MRLAGFKAQSFASAEEFLHSGVLHETGCLISDIRMPGMSGIDLQRRLNEENQRIPIIFITAHGDAPMRLQALRYGAVEFSLSHSTKMPCSRLFVQLLRVERS